MLLLSVQCIMAIILTSARRVFEPVVLCTWTTLEDHGREVCERDLAQVSDSDASVHDQNDTLADHPTDLVGLLRKLCRYLAAGGICLKTNLARFTRFFAFLWPDWSYGDRFRTF